MILKPTDIHDDPDKAKLGFVRAATALGVGFNCNLTTLWKVEIDEKERKAFVTLAQEESRRT
jgi:hypothetical protein